MRSVAITYDYPEPTNGDVESHGGEPVRAGLAVPLPGETGTIGMLDGLHALVRRAPFSAEDRSELEQLAERAGPAIENARRFREARQLADLDALTGLHNRRYFHDTLAREVARAHRYDRRLALIVFDLDDFKAINDRIGHLAGDAVLADAADVVRSVVRSADIACRVGGDEFAVILPESGMPEAEQLYSRLQQALEQRPIGDAGRIRLSAGVAELAQGRRLARVLRASRRRPLRRQGSRQGPRRGRRHRASLSRDGSLRRGRQALEAERVGHVHGGRGGAVVIERVLRHREQTVRRDSRPRVSPASK